MKVNVGSVTLRGAGKVVTKRTCRREHLQEAHGGEENPDFRFKVVKKCKTSLERQVREAVRIQIIGNVKQERHIQQVQAHEDGYR